jgi:hypothetical protein
VAAGSAPQTGQSTAPLILGRLLTCPVTTSVLAKPDDVWRIGVGLLLAISFVGLITRKSLFGSRSDEAPRDDGLGDAASFHAWLDEADANGPPQTAHTRAD